MANADVNKNSTRGAARATPAAPIYTRMRNDILSLALHPGSIVDEEMLSARYGVSRTPVREALIRLSTEGLVLMARKRNAQITPLIMSDLPRYLEALELLQRSVCHLAAMRRLAADIGKIERVRYQFELAFAESDLPEMAVANTAFHVSIAEAGHNAYLTESYEQVLIQGQRMMRLPLLYTPHGGIDSQRYLDDELAEHRQLAEHITAQDKTGAETIGRRHCQRFRQALNAYLNENLTDDISVFASESDVEQAESARAMNYAVQG